VVYRSSTDALEPCRDGNRLYLDKLIRVTENRHAAQCAGRIVVTETAGDFVPRHNQIVSTTAGNVYLLYTAELIAANPMPMVGRPKLAKTLPKALPADAVAALLGAGSPSRRPAAAAAQRLDAARPRPDPDRAAGRTARR
jgi:hypothetical protein